MKKRSGRAWGGRFFLKASSMAPLRFGGGLDEGSKWPEKKSFSMNFRIILSFPLESSLSPCFSMSQQSQSTPAPTRGRTTAPLPTPSYEGEIFAFLSRLGVSKGSPDLAHGPAAQFSSSASPALPLPSVQFTLSLLSHWESASSPQTHGTPSKLDKFDFQWQGKVLFKLPSSSRRCFPAG